MTTRNLNHRKITYFQPHCRRFPPSKPRFSHARGPFILITLIVGILVLLPQGNETIVLPPEEIRTHSCASSMIQTPDGGFVLVGETFQDTGNATTSSSIWMVKTDSTGLLEWNLIFDYLDQVLQLHFLLLCRNCFLLPPNDLFH